MPDVTLVNSSTANGTITPAVATSITVLQGDLLVLVIAALGTSPTIGTPAGWTLIRQTNGATFSFAMFAQLNSAAGATAPSSILGGVTTGWVASMLELSQCGANCGVQGSSQVVNAGGSNLTNGFNLTGFSIPQQMPPGMVAVYSVARADTNTIIPNNTVLNWSPSVRPLSGVQGLSLDTYWASNLGQPFCAFPSCSGKLSTSLASIQIGAFFNTTASNASNQNNVGGLSGQYVGQFNQGMIGG